MLTYGLLLSQKAAGEFESFEGVKDGITLFTPSATRDAPSVSGLLLYISCSLLSSRLLFLLRAFSNLQFPALLLSALRRRHRDLQHVAERGVSVIRFNHGRSRAQQSTIRMTALAFRLYSAP
jgi:hypothetical protein